jgi:hypothetical protein
MYIHTYTSAFIWKEGRKMKEGERRKDGEGRQECRKDEREEGRKLKEGRNKGRKHTHTLIR